MHLFSSFLATLTVLLLTQSLVDGFINRIRRRESDGNRIRRRESDGNGVMDLEVRHMSPLSPSNSLDSTQETEGPDLFQRDAITTQDESVLVVAGPGAGKTRVLSARLAYLLESAICDPNEILIISFTNSAADRLRKKADEILTGSVATTKGVVSDTFHGFCLSFLRKYSHLMYQTNDIKKIVIIDETDQVSIMLSLLEAKGYPPNQSSASNILRQIRYWKELGLGYLGIKKRSLESWTEQRAYDMYPEYTTKLKSLAALDVGDLLLETLRIFRRYPQVLNLYRLQFKHIIVDEFQDVSPAQYDILRMLVLGSRLGSSSSSRVTIDDMSSASGVVDMREGSALYHPPLNEGLDDTKVSVFCAGDDDQSIYGWRGAQVELMRRFRFDFPGTKLLRLQTSYRMHDTLCKVSSAIASPLPGRIQKSLKSQVLLNIFDSDDIIDTANANPSMSNKETRAGIEVRRMVNDDDEISWIVSYLQKKINTMNMNEKIKGDGFSIAILARTQHDLRRIMNAMNECKISYRSRGHGSSTLPTSVMSPINLLKLLIDPDDDVAFQSAIDNDIILSAVTTHDLSSVILLQVKSLAMQKGISLFKSARQCILTSLLKGRYATALSRFIQKYDAWRSDFQRYYRRGESGQKTIRSILYSAYSSRWNNEFSRAVDELSKSACGFNSLNNFFETIQLEGDYVVDQSIVSVSSSSSGSLAPRTSRITIWTMVMHAAKGLEFDEVLLPFWVDGNVPKSNSPDERRLAFVSLTRARERVMISYAQRKINSMTKKSFVLKPSPYIDEIFDVNNSFITFEDVASIAADRPIVSSIVISPSQSKENNVKGFINQSNSMQSTNVNAGVRVGDGGSSALRGKVSGTHPYLSEDLRKIMTKQSSELSVDAGGVDTSTSITVAVSTNPKNNGQSPAGRSLFPQASQLTSLDINRLMFQSKATKTELKAYFKDVLASLYQFKRGLIELTSDEGVVSTKQLSRATAIELGKYLILKMKTKN